MIKYIIVLILLFTAQGYCEYLGEFEQGEDIYIWAQFLNTNISATNVTVSRCSLFDRNSASAPTASGAMVEWHNGVNTGLFRYAYLGGRETALATGPCVARWKGIIGGNDEVSGLRTFLMLNTGNSPNKMAVNVSDIEASLPTVRGDHSIIIDEIRKNR